YLGEIAYYTKNYPQAIRYYKKSASLYNSASYMPILYLHTAIALARDGQKEQARNFFQFVVDSYPNTKAANIAKKNL
ncbi:MAG TPA: tetratricopeptide repeat protein, partial [Campylobacterales bacterium]|nr:tetratricopeptide repeat protein [Campylobacterales bacterium]